MREFSLLGTCCWANGETMYVGFFFVSTVLVRSFGACFSGVEVTRVSMLIIRSRELFEVELRRVRSDFVNFVPIVCIPFRHSRAAAD